MRRTPAADQPAGPYPDSGASTRRPAAAGIAVTSRSGALREHLRNRDYFREAESWDTDRVAQSRRSVAWPPGWRGAGWTCAIACAAALVLLMPLKRVEPFVVRVDNATGIVDVVPDL